MKIWGGELPRIETPLLLVANKRLDDVGVPRIGNGQGTNAKVLSASRPKGDVVALVVLNQRLGKECVVLDLRLPGLADKAVSQAGCQKSQSLEKRLGTIQ